MTDETKREILKAHRLGYSNDIIASVCEITEEEVEAIIGEKPLKEVEE
jgi:hypothetical protein